jgi:hypothetical protein
VFRAARGGDCRWVGRRTVRGGAAKRKAIEKQIAEETRFKQRATMAMGTVTALRDTGTTINDNPEPAITVTYTRADGTTAQVEAIEVVLRLEIPRRGDPATVWYDPSTGKGSREARQPAITQRAGEIPGHALPPLDRAAHIYGQTTSQSSGLIRAVSTAGRPLTQARWI